MTYIVDINQANGDIVDRLYFGSRYTMVRWLEDNHVTDIQLAGKYTYPDETSVEYGAWPGGDETDYDVYDAYDDSLLWKGLHSD